MSNNSKTALIVILILLIPVGLGLGIYCYRKKNAASENDNDPGESGSTPSSNSGTSAVVVSTTNNQYFPLKKNSKVKSDLVKSLQKLLNERIEGLQAPAVPYYAGSPITSLVVDGYYGDKTAAVVKYVLKNDGNSVTQDEYNSLSNPSYSFIF